MTCCISDRMTEVGVAPSEYLSLSNSATPSIPTSAGASGMASP
eukprot:CAMPEP_0184436190 /NCGR_PEP_ID=MMETSP0738-20130409/527108_1 /TAXON_ID=385413 /ORGANISM="Thalassiosira miniscula, Strain CCMP1093" /LENGTH=42 /DNA_ID= /DNA_START= /DNA_END= /DNA_ORIENTATION=